MADATDIITFTNKRFGQSNFIYSFNNKSGQ